MKSNQQPEPLRDNDGFDLLPGAQWTKWTLPDPIEAQSLEQSLTRKRLWTFLKVQNTSNTHRTTNQVMQGAWTEIQVSHHQNFSNSAPLKLSLQSKRRKLQKTE